MTTPADQLGIGEDLGNFVAMSQPQFSVLFFDVALPLAGQLDLGAKPGAGKPTDHMSWISTLDFAANVQ